MNASDYGQLLFDKSGKLLKANDLAISKLSVVINSQSNAMTQSAFLNYLFDKSVDFDESIKNTIMSHFDVGSEPEFREVIQIGEANLCLVNARKIEGKMTLFTLIDISAGREREEYLEHLNTINYQLMQVVQATSTGIVISDPKQQGNPILFANDAFCFFVDSTPEDVSDGGWGALIPMFTDVSERTKYIDALSNYNEAEFELEYRNGEHNSRHYTMTLSPVYKEGELDLFIGLLSDITLLKQREAEFFQAQKLESLGKLAAGIAHDFNNVLSIIIGYSTMATKILPPDLEKEHDYLLKISAAAQRGAGLTRKMLTFGRHRVVTKDTIDICEVVEEQSALLTPLLGVLVNMDITVSDDLRKSGIYISGNTSSIEQILMNLVVNACDAMEEGGKLLVDLSCPQSSEVPEKVRNTTNAADYVCLRVSDTGSGMDERLVEHIFDPFFTTKEHGKGTGLGLSVVYGLTQELGGAMDVVSEVGQGSQMSVYLPRIDGVGYKSTKCKPDECNNVSLDGFTILVVEDEIDLLNVMVSLLEERGINVLSASNGDDALVLQEEHEEQIDILLTDVLMPGMSGVKLAKLITSLRPNIKVIYMSGYPADGGVMSIGIPDNAVLVVKPIEYERLLCILYQTLNNIRSDAEIIDDISHWEHSNTNVEGQE